MSGSRAKGLKKFNCNFKGNFSDRSVNLSFFSLKSDQKCHMVGSYCRNNILLFVSPWLLMGILLVWDWTRKYFKPVHHLLAGASGRAV